MKKLELALTQAWQKNSPMLKLLSPLSALYGGISQYRKSLYLTGKKQSYHAPVPVLVIGNITVGGSGKTPLIIALVKYLQTKSISVGVISRGYGRKQSTPAVVQADSTPKAVGDEPCLIVGETGVPMAVGANRGQAIELLLQHYPDLQLIISDDGLQHYALHRDAEWIVVDGVRGFGNGKLFPQGFLREPLSRLDGAMVVYHDARTHLYDDKTMRMYLTPSQPVPLLGGCQSLPTQQVYGVSGIGYPDRFFQTLADLHFTVVKKPFGDHHDFTLDDLVSLSDLPIITTSKDAVKLRTLAEQTSHSIFENVWVLPVQSVLSQAVYDKMDELLVELGIN